MRTIFLFLCFAVLVLTLLVMSSLARTGTMAPVMRVAVQLPHAVQRLNQVDCRQYASEQACATWSPSACSAAAMAEAMNAYGHAYRIADVLSVEAAFRNPMVITPAQGLLYPGGLDRTLAAFGFRTSWLQHPTVAQVIAQAAHAPIIVNFPPSRWAGGHFLIVTGGDSHYVYLADSSRLDLHAMSYATFLSYWVGFAVEVLPGQKGGLS
jgi:ABC-type bacteriocin/lantibiotic exporter with double-glycine peptidase domain